MAPRRADVVVADVAYVLASVTTAEDPAVHVRTERSTYRFHLEAPLAHAGLAVREATLRRRDYAPCRCGRSRRTVEGPSPGCPRRASPGQGDADGPGSRSEPTANGEVLIVEATERPAASPASGRRPPRCRLGDRVGASARHPAPTFGADIRRTAVGSDRRP